MHKGPKTSDEVFFRDVISDNLKDVCAYARDGKYDLARKSFASYIRSFLDRDKFFSIPYETPENIYKLEGETDQEACKRIENYRMVSVGVLGDFSEEGRVNWTANPTYNNYREWTWQLSRHNEIKMMAHEYNRTHDEKIARTALDIMHSWLEDAIVPEIGTSGYDTLCWRTIECGIRMGANWPYILFAFIDSPYFTDDLIVDWFKSVYEHAVRLTNDYTRANWLIMEMNGLSHIGILFPFFKDAENWRSMALEFLERELDKQFYRDGFQFELTTNYHDVVICNYQRLFETAKAFNYPIPESMKKKLLNACNLMVKIMMSDGTLPDLNDGRRVAASELLEPKRRFFSSPEIDFALGKGPAPDYRSIVLPYSGFAIFRTGWNRDDVWALLDGGPFGRAHQHEDKLNLLIYGAGRYLLTEGGIYAYDDSDMRKYFISTRAHNTIRVDRKDQDRRTSYSWNDEDIEKLSGIVSNIPSETIEYAESTYDENYAGIDDKVAHTRRVYFLRNERVFVVVDHMKAGKSHEYEMIYHVDDERLEGTEFKDIRFKILSDNVKTEIVRGMETPEIQGFVSYGQAQGSYKPVDTILSHFNGKERTVVTLIEIKDGKGSEVKDARVQDDSVILDFGYRTETLSLSDK